MSDHDSDDDGSDFSERNFSTDEDESDSESDEDDFDMDASFASTTSSPDSQPQARRSTVTHAELCAMFGSSAMSDADISLLRNHFDHDRPWAQRVILPGGIELNDENQDETILLGDLSDLGGDPNVKPTKVVLRFLRGLAKHHDPHFGTNHDFCISKSVVHKGINRSSIFAYIKCKSFGDTRRSHHGPETPSPTSSPTPMPPSATTPSPKSKQAARKVWRSRCVDCPLRINVKFTRGKWFIVHHNLTHQFHAAKGAAEPVVHRTVPEELRHLAALLSSRDGIHGDAGKVTTLLQSLVGPNDIISKGAVRRSGLQHSDEKAQLELAHALTLIRDMGAESSPTRRRCVGPAHTRPCIFPHVLKFCFCLFSFLLPQQRD